MDEYGLITEIYPPHYYPGDTPFDHLEFALKYDHLDLNFLKSVFSLIDPAGLVQRILSKPRSVYHRRIGFLYEFLLGIRLPIPDLQKANYVPLIDSDKYLVGSVTKNPRWLIDDNLLGNRDFCPVIRKTATVINLLDENFQVLLNELTQTFPPDIFHRAVSYLYTKETRSSYQIEHEKPVPERINRFIRLLEQAGDQPLQDLLSEYQLTSLQNQIVDPRFAADGYRNFQNYIGQTTYNYKQIIHYVCPPPQFVSTLMQGLLHSALKTTSLHPVFRAAITAFGFVFIHPFEDGNGRLHRFLIHDMLTRSGLVPKGMIIPVSANMLNHFGEYNQALESFSKPLLEIIQYELNDFQEMTVKNPDTVEAYFRYPDLTLQASYLGKTIRQTIKEDIYSEMEFLVNYDEVKSAFSHIVDMPDKNFDLFIRFLHQNKGSFPNRRRKQFDMLSDSEISQMESVFRDIFSIPGQSSERGAKD